MGMGENVQFISAFPIWARPVAQAPISLALTQKDP